MRILNDLQVPTPRRPGAGVWAQRVAILVRILDHVHLPPINSRLRSSDTPRATTTEAELEQLEMPKSSGPMTGFHSPRAAIESTPLEQLEVPPLRSGSTRFLIPRTASKPAPLQDGKLPCSGGRATGAHTPPAPARYGPLQDHQVPPAGRRGASSLIPRAVAGAQPLQDVKVTLACRLCAGRRGKGAPFPFDPLQRRQITAPGGSAGRAVIPATPPRSAPPEHLEVLAPRRRGTSRGRPGTPHRPGRLEHLQVATSRRLRTHSLVPGTPAAACREEQREVPPPCGQPARLLVPRAPLPPRPPQDLQVSDPRRDGAPVDPLAGQAEAEAVAELGQRGLRRDVGGESAAPPPGPLPAPGHGRKEQELLVRDEAHQVGEDVGAGRDRTLGRPGGVRAGALATGRPAAFLPAFGTPLCCEEGGGGMRTTRCESGGRADGTRLLPFFQHGNACFAKRVTTATNSCVRNTVVCVVGGDFLDHYLKSIESSDKFFTLLPRQGISERACCLEPRNHLGAPLLWSRLYLAGCRCGSRAYVRTLAEKNIREEPRLNNACTQLFTHGPVYSAWSLCTLFLLLPAVWYGCMIQHPEVREAKLTRCCNIYLPLRQR